MLLPSSLDCAPRKHLRTASYIPVTTMLSPPSSSTTCPSPASSTFSTRRTLQSLLASNLASLSSTPKPIRALSPPPSLQPPPPKLGSPIVLTSGSRAQSKNKKAHTVLNAKVMKAHPVRAPPPPLRSNLKRRRSFSEYF